MIGHFPEGRLMVEHLRSARLDGLGFETAWTAAMMHVQRGRLETNPRWAEVATGLRFARAAFERAYHGHERTRQDVIASALMDACEAMLDDSEALHPTALLEVA